MKLTPSRLRANIYRILDKILESGEPVEIEHRGRTLRIVPVEPKSWLDRIEPIPGFLKCDPDEIVHMDWSSEWNPDPT